VEGRPPDDVRPAPAEVPHAAIPGHPCLDREPARVRCRSCAGLGRSEVV